MGSNPEPRDASHGARPLCYRCDTSLALQTYASVTLDNFGPWLEARRVPHLPASLPHITSAPETSKSLSFDLRKSLVQSLVLPFFDYACLVYHDLTGELNLRLQRAQNVCNRFVYGNILWTDHVTAYRQKLDWLPVKGRREYFLDTLTFSLLQTNRPVYLISNLILTTNRGVRRFTRHGVLTFFIRHFPAAYPISGTI
ncbi:hypothetical protein TSAR_009821 [Trichomalopsis sarcophagae]|uniref:Uncharacterized protein n=1 Tax=Trichomalopsis sarcophagae TaxID=543379 RepID=A0A232ENZ0_9HYME|nr:hypothetical protein TSAR_009821 [Trichomalopsis sarcophagae]